MDAVISFTPGQFLACVASVCAGISSIAAVIAIFSKVIHKAKAPNLLQDTKIANLENRVSRLEELHDEEKTKITTIEKENHITQRALLALLKHGIDGNDIEAMRSSRDELEKYLTDK